MMQEAWKTIPEFPEYEVSNLGNARRVGSRHILKQFGGRISVHGGIRLHVCDFVSALFIGEKPDGYIVWHINGNRHDNSVANLKYVPKDYYGEEDKEGEKWLDIAGYEGLYQVSSFGRVRAMYRNGMRRVLKQQILNASITPYGYKAIGLSDINGVVRTFLVHRLVAMAFIPNPDNLPVINHKDENKLNNRVDNIEWCTRAYNNTYNDGAKKKGRKLMRAICVEHEGKRVMEFDSIKNAAIYFKTSPSTISGRLKFGYKSKNEGYTFIYK